MHLRRRFLALATAAAAALSLAALPAPAAAAGPLAPGAVGSDVSWPQCKTAPDGPGAYSFGIVGVTGGKPFTPNDCFAREYTWAMGTGTAEVYLNLDYGQSTAGPLDCTDGDTGCLAYNYGYEAAAYGYRYAAYRTWNASRHLSVWWLDVETENVWNDDTQLNSYVIQGAIDYLSRIEGKVVGVYSTAYQWSEIAGSFAPPSTPNWVAGASGLDDVAKCSTPLWSGGSVWAIQYLNFDLDLDQNRAC